MLMATPNLVGTAGSGHHRVITVEPLIGPGATPAHERTTRRAATCKEAR